MYSLRDLLRSELIGVYAWIQVDLFIDSIFLFLHYHKKKKKKTYDTNISDSFFLQIVLTEQKVQIFVYELQNALN